MRLWPLKRQHGTWPYNIERMEWTIEGEIERPCRPGLEHSNHIYPTPPRYPPRVLVLCEMQSGSSRIWTRVVVSTSCNDNHYTMGTSSHSNKTVKITKPQKPVHKKENLALQQVKHRQRYPKKKNVYKNNDREDREKRDPLCREKRRMQKMWLSTLR